MPRFRHLRETPDSKDGGRNHLDDASSRPAAKPESSKPLDIMAQEVLQTFSYMSVVVHQFEQLSRIQTPDENQQRSLRGIRSDARIKVPFLLQLMESHMYLREYFAELSYDLKMMSHHELSVKYPQLIIPEDLERFSRIVDKTLEAFVNLPRYKEMLGKLNRE